jgi:hypothetical protein
VKPPEHEHQSDHQHDPGSFGHGLRAFARSVANIAVKVTFSDERLHDIAQSPQARPRARRSERSGPCNGIDLARI